MKLKLDRNRVYAVALEGGGARGAYQVGAWRALEEAGIRYGAVAGSSVGALNGALMAMRSLHSAEEIWENIRFSQVMDVDDDIMRRLFDHDLSGINLTELARGILGVLKNGGFDVTPLREWLAEAVDEERVRSSDVEFFIAAFSLTDRRELYLRAKDLAPGSLCDMLLASAYFPAFRNVPLGGKRYLDGGVQDVLPLTPLIEHGYRDIIAIRVFGAGVEKHITIPDDAAVTTIAPTRKLGPLLDFDAQLSREQKRLGYFDAMRVLYGLTGNIYYLDPTWSEEEAYTHLTALVSRFGLWKEAPGSLRELNEEALPRLARRLHAGGDYRDLLIACLERLAQAAGISPYEIMTDAQLEERVLAAENSCEILCRLRLEAEK